MPRCAGRWAELADRLLAVERWLIPGECLLCHEAAGPEDALVCGPCRLRWAPLPELRCLRCGQPNPPGVACRLCEQWPRELAGVQSGVWLEEGARQAVHLFKYSGWRRMADPMAASMRRLIILPRNATLIPIPLSATRERTRGYNQSAALAESLGRAFDLPIATGVLRRTRETPTQTALAPEARRANLAGAFVAVGPLPVMPVLVDDVFTTGATLAEAAVALAGAGADAIGAVTFARAPRPLAEAARFLGGATMDGGPG